MGLLTVALTEKQLAFLETVPTSAAGIVRRALEGGSRATAVKAKCLCCCNFVRDEIRNCGVVICPLHAYRPFRGGVPEEEGPEEELELEQLSPEDLV